MAIVHTFDADGAFIVGDTDTRATSYAYPSSVHATQAKRNPAKVAAEMITQENAFRRQAHVDFTNDHDITNWRKLNLSLSNLVTIPKWRKG